MEIYQDVEEKYFLLILTFGNFLWPNAIELGSLPASVEDKEVKDPMIQRQVLFLLPISKVSNQNLPELQIQRAQMSLPDTFISRKRKQRLKKD
jgi:hypothetical protein